MNSIYRIGAGLLAMAAVPAQAQICEVNTAGRLGVDSASVLFVDFVGAGIISICSMNGTDAGGTTKEACAAWYGALLTYKATRVRAQFYFSNSNPVNADLTSCGNLGDWRARALFHGIYPIASYSRHCIVL